MSGNGLSDCPYLALAVAVRALPIPGRLIADGIAPARVTRPAPVAATETSTVTSVIVIVIEEVGGIVRDRLVAKDLVHPVTATIGGIGTDAGADQSIRLVIGTRGTAGAMIGGEILFLGLGSDAQSRPAQPCTYLVRRSGRRSPRYDEAPRSPSPAPVSPARSPSPK
jgi:hypothetical protein